MRSGKVGRPAIGGRYEFARPEGLAEDTRELAGYFGVPEAEVTRIALEIGLNRLRARAGFGSVSRSARQLKVAGAKA
jgi:hypothetical protein